MNAKPTKGKKSRRVEKAPGQERAPTVPVPDVPRTEEERARAATLATIVDAMIDPVFVLDLEGRCVFANRAHFQMFGLEPKNIMGKSIMETSGVEKQKPEEVEKFMPLIREAIERGNAGPVELVLVAMDGREIPLSISGGMIKDAQGNPTHIVAVLRDITERKRAEERLRASENKYRTLLENLPQKIFLKDRDSVYISCNENYARDRKIKPEELVGKTDYDFYPKELAEKYIANDKRVVESGETIEVEEEYIQDGQEVITHTVKTPAKDEQGNIIGLLGIFWDITERKRAEEALRESKERYRTLFESTADGILIADTKTRKFKYVNPAVCRILGYSEEELTRMGVKDIHPKDALEHVIHEFEAQARGEKTLSPNIPCLRKDGTIIYADINATKALIDGRECFIGFFRDITERKRAEEELVRLSNAVTMSTDSIVISDLEGKIIDVNKATLEMYGMDDKRDLIGKNSFDLIAPEDREIAFAGMKEAVEKGYTKGREYRIITKDGSRIPVEMSSSVMKDADGKPIGFVGISRDITERKRAKEELQKRAIIIDSTTDAVITMDLKGNIIFCNKGAEMMYGYTAKEMIGNPIAILYPKQELSKLGKIIENLLKGKKIPNIEVTVKHKNKKLLPIIMSLAPIKDEKGKVIELVGIAQNITELKRVEEALRESEARSRLILETMPSGLFTVDLDKRITVWSKGAEEITGLKAKQVIGKTCLEALDCDECKKGCALFDDRVDKPIYGKECAIHVDGRDIIVSKNADILKDSEGNTIGGLENFVDITERKQAEEVKLKAAANKQRMEELEKFAKIAVGRELKMVELKNQITALELRLEGITEKG